MKNHNNTAVAHNVTISPEGGVKIEFGTTANDSHHDNAIGEIHAKDGSNFTHLNNQLQAMQEMKMIAPDTTLALAEAHKDASLEMGNPSANDAILGKHTENLAQQQSTTSELTR